MVEIVSPYTELRRSGQQFTGLCPFHEERTPSFSVEPVKKVYHCYGCQVGGDVFRFVAEQEGLEFAQVVEQLADRYGVELEREDADPQEEERRRRRERLLALLDRTADFYVRYLWESEEAVKARSYLAERGLENQVLRDFRIGFAPSAWDRVLAAAKRDGAVDQEIRDSGLAQRNAEGRLYDRFRGRIMFPLADARGRVLGFGARALSEDQKPKYVNSPEGPVYHKGRTLFGLDRARQSAARAGEVVVVEGYTDVLALHQAGIANAVAIMGTALTGDQLAELGRVARTVRMALDADRSGEDAMLRAQGLARTRQLELSVVRLPAGEDPADLVRDQGGEAFQGRIDEAISLLEFQVRSALERADLSSGPGKTKAFEALRTIFAAAAPSPEKADLAREASSRLELPAGLEAELYAAEPVPAGEGATGSEGAAQALRKADRLERGFLTLVLAHPEQGRPQLEELPEEVFRSTPLRRVRAWILAGAESGTGDAELEALVAGLRIEGAEGGADAEALDEQGRRLQERELLAAIDRHRAELESGGDAGTERELAALTRRLQELRAQIRYGAGP